MPQSTGVSAIRCTLIQAIYAWMDSDGDPGEPRNHKGEGDRIEKKNSDKSKYTCGRVSS